MRIMSRVHETRRQGDQLWRELSSSGCCAEALSYPGIASKMKAETFSKVL